MESARLLLVDRCIDDLSVDRRELSELVEVNLHVLTLLQEVTYQLEEVVERILQDLFVKIGGFGHGGEVGLDGGTHDDALCLLDLLLALLVLEAIVGEEGVRELDVDDLDAVACRRKTDRAYLIGFTLRIFNSNKIKS